MKSENNINYNELRKMVMEARNDAFLNSCLRRRREVVNALANLDKKKMKSKEQSDHIHQYATYKEVLVPTGKYSVVDKYMNDAVAKPITEPHLIMYCLHCGKVIIKPIPKTQP